MASHDGSRRLLTVTFTGTGPVLVGTGRCWAQRTSRYAQDVWKPAHPPVDCATVTPRVNIKIMQAITHRPMDGFPNDRGQQARSRAFGRVSGCLAVGREWCIDALHVAGLAIIIVDGISRWNSVVSTVTSMRSVPTLRSAATCLTQRTSRCAQDRWHSAFTAVGCGILSASVYAIIMQGHNTSAVR